MAELRTRVEELKMENEYQLRLKDMNYNEKIKELTEKFIQEMESLKTKVKRRMRITRNKRVWQAYKRIKRHKLSESQMDR